MKILIKNSKASLFLNYLNGNSAFVDLNNYSSDSDWSKVGETLSLTVTSKQTVVYNKKCTIVILLLYYSTDIYYICISNKHIYVKTL